MPYFTRLTDIITCSLTEILDESSDPETTLRDVIREMEEGLAGARRTVRASDGNRQRLRAEIEQHEAQMQKWVDRARQSLVGQNENDARESLTRKVELEDLLDGLRPELDAAESTYQHMLRIRKALEARHSEAMRRLFELTGKREPVQLESETAVHAISRSQQEKQDEVEAELAALRRQLDE